MSARACGLCAMPARNGKRVYAVDERGKLRRVRACSKCARGAVPIVVAVPKRAPALCRAKLACKGKAHATACDACRLVERKTAVRAALESTGKGATS